MEIQALGVAVAATLGITEVAKHAQLPIRFVPLFSLVIGIVTTFIFTGSFTLGTVGIGLVTGLSAGGMWSGAKTTFGKKV